MKKIKIPSHKKDLRIIAWFVVVILLLGAMAWWAWRRYVTEPPYVDPDRYPVRGIDISRHNGYPNLDAAARSGYDFVWIKASEGVDFHDANFALNYEKARHSGLKVGAYHFFRFDRDGVEQAVNLLKAIGNRHLDMGVAIDVEESFNARDVPIDTIKQRLALMAEYLNMRGQRVIFYSNRDGWEKYLLPEFRGYPLWICSFTDNSNRDDWTFWQFNHHGKVPGLHGDVDINTFSGSRSDWEEWLLQ